MLTLGIRFKIFMNPNGEKAAKYLESLGPIFIKFGQLLSTRTDILDIDTATELQSLTDSWKPFSVKELKKIVKKNNKCFLISKLGNHNHFIEIIEDNETQVWGVVTYVIHKVKK